MLLPFFRIIQSLQPKHSPTKFPSQLVKYLKSNFQPLISQGDLWTTGTGISLPQGFAANYFYLSLHKWLIYEGLQLRLSSGIIHEACALTAFHPERSVLWFEKVRHGSACAGRSELFYCSKVLLISAANSTS